MIGLFQRVWAKLTAFTFGWPSWLTECASGLVAVALALLLLWAWGRLPHLWAVAVTATALSVVYEVKLDAHGWSLADVAEREVGIVLGVALLALLGA